MADGGIGDDESADHSPCLPIILAVGHNERFEHDYSPDSDQFPWPSMDRRPARVLVGSARSVRQSSAVTVRLQRATAMTNRPIIRLPFRSSLRSAIMSASSTIIVRPQG